MNTYWRVMPAMLKGAANALDALLLPRRALLDSPTPNYALDSLCRS